MQQILALLTLSATLGLVFSSDPGSQFDAKYSDSPLAALFRDSPLRVKKSIQSPNGRELVDVSNLCLDAGCVHAASHILEKMNLNVNPCDDFYEFACGKYDKETVIPDDQTSVNTFSVMRDNLKEKLRVVLDEPITEKDIPLFKKTKQLYLTCMNKTAIEKLGAKPLLNIFKSLGGFPAIESSWSSKDFSWLELIKKFRMMGLTIDYLFDFSISIDVSNTTRRRIDLDQPGHFLTREYLVQGREHKNVAAFYEYFKDLLVLFGADPVKAKEDASKVIDFSIELAKLTTPKEERRNASLLNNPFTLKEFQKKYDWVDWYGFLGAILPPDIAVGEDEIINVSDLKFFDGLGEFLKKSSKRTIANFLIGRVAVSKIIYLNSVFRKRLLEYQTVAFGKTEEEARSKECVETTLSKLPNAVSALYVREYFNEDSRKTALEMVDDIKKQFGTRLKKVDWMDEATKVEAQGKLDKMASLIGYPEELNDDKFLSDFYKDLEVVENQYIKTTLKIHMFLSEIAYRQLREPVIKNDWRTWGKAAQVNAFYNRAHNHIRFPAGILAGHFFSADRPKYLNYAAIGSVIGHEITHGFDDQGRQFDADGNLRDWWDPKTSEAFKERAKCIIEEFSKTRDPQTNLTLNGVATQGENIADMGGIQTAYVAYKNFAERDGVEKQLPGLQQFTAEQMFWVATSQNWCSKVKDEAQKLQIARNAHAPGKYRVLLPLKHNKAFAKDFKCPVNSPMNPKDKCKLW